MLNYQMAVFFFAWLDVLSTLLSVLTLYAWPSTKGLQLWQSLSLLLLLGPACGYLGASKLKRPSRAAMMPIDKYGKMGCTWISLLT
jgi:hypothetical protein